MPTKKTPVKKTAPKKKSAKKVPQKKSPGKKVKGQTVSGFKLEVSNRKTVVVRKQGRFVFVNRSLDLTNGDSILVVTEESPPSIQMPQEDVKVVTKATTGPGLIKAIGFNVPPNNNTPANIKTNLSIFNNIKRDPAGSKIEFKKTAAGQIIFTMGIEG